MLLSKFIKKLEKEKEKFKKKHPKAYAPEVTEIDYDYNCYPELTIELCAEQRGTDEVINEKIEIRM